MPFIETTDHHVKLSGRVDLKLRSRPLGYLESVFNRQFDMQLPFNSRR
jgi:hypothetical protein